MQNESQSIDQTSKVPQPPRLDKPVRIIEQAWPEGTVPVVSVFNWVYNHEKFVRESIESILMQETTFPVEIIIHDDASNDGTADIIREYEEQYPRLFRNVLHSENQHSQGRSLLKALFYNPKGDFIALTHGDDYWTDPNKLQIQADYLSHRSGCAGCFHRTRVVDGQGSVIREDFFVADQESYDFRACLTTLSKQYATCSMMIRADAVRNPSSWLRRRPVDMMLELQVARYGVIAYINKNMADYRLHDAGVWTRLSIRDQALEIIHRYQVLMEDDELQSEYREEILTRIGQFSDMLVLRSEYEALNQNLHGRRHCKLLRLPKKLLHYLFKLR